MAIFMTRALCCPGLLAVEPRLLTRAVQRELLLQLHHALAPIVFALALAAFFGCGIRRYEDRLTALAERALPGSLVAAVDEKRDHKA
jgi:hypothetical protein